MNGTVVVVKGLDLGPLEADSTHKAERVSERLDLVNHVKVQLMVAVGSAEIEIGRLFALGTGETLVLDREVDAPVDVRLNGKLIARGELVAAGDHFGVRITEIAAE
jgi:flagellar motor switch protein FliN/FliY